MCPCVAAGAALESAVFESASCVFSVQGGRGGAHNPAKAGFWRSLLLFIKKCLELCIGLYAERWLFPLAPTHTTSVGI